MTPEEQSGASSSASSASPRRAGPSRRRRSFRPGPRPPRRGPSGQAQQTSQTGEKGRETDLRETVEAASDAEAITENASAEGERLPVGEARSANVPAGPAIQEAIGSVQRINKELEVLLLEMQKALETLEEAELQKYADEREIESLRAAVRQLNRPRENQQRPHQSQARPDQRNRPPQREQRFQASHRQRPEQRPPDKSPEPHAADQPVEPREHEEERHREPPQDRDVPF